MFVVALAGCGGSSITIAMVQQNNSGQDGFATLTEKDDKVEVLVSIKRSNIGGSQTSHVHEGRCDNVGPITAGVGMMQLEISSKDGSADFENDQVKFTTTLPARLEKLRDGNHVINVHDARDPSLYVSCGEID
jgi:hypothetical protein